MTSQPEFRFGHAVVQRANYRMDRMPPMIR
jgi:hypothetical protein